MEIISKIGSILSSGHFKISVIVFLFIAIIGLLVTSKEKKKANEILERIDNQRNFKEEDVDINYIEKNKYQQKYNDLIKPYVNKNKKFFDKMRGYLGIDLDDLKKKLIRSNIYSINAEQVAVIKISGLLLGGIVGITLFLLMGMLGLCVGLLIAAAMILLPDMLIEEKYKNRKDEILYLLPTTLRLMSDATSTGHTISDAITRVSRKYKNILSDEFKKAEKEAKYSNDWLLALDHMADRCDIDELYNLMAEIKITQEKGTPITDVLLNFANKIDEEASLSISEKARKKNTTLLLPILLFLFAPLIGIVLLPAFDMVLNSL